MKKLLLLMVLFPALAWGQTKNGETTAFLGWDTGIEFYANIPVGTTTAVLVLTGKQGVDSVYIGSDIFTTYTDQVIYGANFVNLYALGNPDIDDSVKIRVIWTGYATSHMCLFTFSNGPTSNILYSVDKETGWISSGSGFVNTTGDRLVIAASVHENNGNQWYWNPAGRYVYQDSSNYPSGQIAIDTASGDTHNWTGWTGDDPTTNAISFIMAAINGPAPVADTVDPYVGSYSWSPRVTGDSLTSNILRLEVNDGPDEFDALDSVYLWRDGVLKFQVKLPNTPADTTMLFNMGAWYGTQTISVRMRDTSDNIGTYSIQRRSGISTVTTVTGYLPNWSWGAPQGVYVTGGQFMTPQTVPWNVLTDVVHFGVNALDTAGWKRDSIVYSGNNTLSPRYPYLTLTAPRYGWFDGWFVYDSTTAYQADSASTNVTFSIEDRQTFKFSTDSADLNHNYWRELYQDLTPNPQRYIDSMHRYSRAPIMTGGLEDTVRLHLSLGGIYGAGANAYNFMHQKNDSVWMYDFYKAIVGYANRIGYDGIEVDWEPPLNESSMSKMIRMLKREMTAQAGTCRLISIAAAGCCLGSYSPVYADSVFRYNVMMYDGTYLASGWGVGWNMPVDRMGMNAPLYALPEGDTTKYGNALYYVQPFYDGKGHTWEYGYGWHPSNTNYAAWDYSPTRPKRLVWGMEYWQDSVGMPGEKIGTLMPTFGYSFLNVGMSDSSGLDRRGITRLLDTYPFPGKRPYYESWNGSGWDTVRSYSQYLFANMIDYLEANNALTKRYDDTLETPFMFGKSTLDLSGPYWPAPDINQWAYITYEDTVSMREKAKWAKALGLGGIGFYEIFASWRAWDSNDRMPLIRVAMDEIISGSGTGDQTPGETVYPAVPGRKYKGRKPR